MAQATVTILKDADFRKQIKTAPARGYLFFGEEDYLKDFTLREARSTLLPDESLACFNEVTLDSLTYSAEALRGALMPLPMMADCKLVVVRGLDFNSFKPHELDALCEVLAELPEYDYNTLIFSVASGAIDQGFLPKKPSKLLCRLGEYLTPVQFEQCTPAKLGGWCARHFEHNGAAASPALIAALIESCGRDMLTLASEIDKLSYYVLSRGRKEVTREDITAVACTTVEYDTFAFSGALMERNAPRALAILSDLKARRVEPLIILGEIVTAASNMLMTLRLAQNGATNAEIAKDLKQATGKPVHEYTVSLYRQHALRAGESTVRRMVDACLAADRSLKLSPRGYEAIEMLICSI